MFERATRLWAMSPMMATSRREKDLPWRRMVKASSRAWVGCSWAPSPALITAASMCLSKKCGEPAARWRITRMSGCMAWRFRAVSSRDSPFLALEVEGDRFSPSADRRFSAISKEARVRVLGSMNRFTTVLPRRVGTFLMRRSEIS
jgi:hypothetical protein